MLRSIRLPLVLTAPLAMLVASLASGQRAEEEDVATFDRTPQSCITVSRIDRTEVIDDRTVIFHMRGRDAAYRNYLPRRCPNLARNNRFMYEVRGSQLCDIDTITVLEQFGTRLDRGFTCRLGEFHPVTAEDIEELKRVVEGGGSDAVESEPVELPEDEDTDAEE